MKKLQTSQLPIFDYGSQVKVLPKGCCRRSLSVWVRTHSQFLVGTKEARMCVFPLPDIVVTLSLTTSIIFESVNRRNDSLNRHFLTGPSSAFPQKRRRRPDHHHHHHHDYSPPFLLLHDDDNTVSIAQQQWKRIQG